MTAHWLSANWFSVIQTIALIITLTITVSALRSSRNATKGANLLALAAAHRQIWQQVITNPNLKRVLRPTMAANESVTDEEREFAVHVFHHSSTAFEILQMGGLPPFEGFRRDAYETMQLPVFQIVWSEYKKYQQGAFVAFIDSCMAGVNLDDSVGRAPRRGLRAIRRQVTHMLPLGNARQADPSGPEIAQHPRSS